MTTFVVPIEGLTTVATWPVGPVLIRPASEVLGELRRGSADTPAASWFFDAVEEMRAGAFAQVDAEDFDEAIVLVTQAVDVMRVFQHVRHYMTALTQFGVAGDVHRSVLPYAVTQGDKAGLGFKGRGDALGWTLSDPAEWKGAEVFHWFASGIGAASPTEAQRRALRSLPPPPDWDARLGPL